MIKLVCEHCGKINEKQSEDISDIIMSQRLIFELRSRIDELTGVTRFLSNDIRSEIGLSVQQGFIDAIDELRESLDDDNN